METRTATSTTGPWSSPPPGWSCKANFCWSSRDAKAIEHYLPKLRRCANFIETRRDPKNNLFLVGVAGNLHGPNYPGWKKPDGTFAKAYLTGLSITYIAALDRLIELEKLAGAAENVSFTPSAAIWPEKGCRC